MIVIDGYLEAMCVYPKPSRLYIGTPFKLDKLKNHLETSNSGSQDVELEHRRLLGLLALEYMQYSPKHFDTLLSSVQEAVERLKEKKVKSNDNDGLESLRMCLALR